MRLLYVQVKTKTQTKTQTQIKSERGDPLEVNNLLICSPQREEIDLDFRVSGFPHAVVKQAENFRVRELVKKIESHLIDKRFKPIYNKVMPTTDIVQNQRR